MIKEVDKNISVDKTKLIFVQDDRKISDEELKGEATSYYKDAWQRFKKNGASVAATIIISIILLFTIIGPHLRGYKLIDENPSYALKFNYLPPRVPGLEKLGIFDGTRVVKGRNKLFIESLPEGIVKEVVLEYESGNNILQDAKVDYYKYYNYIRAYGDGVEKVVIVENLSKADYETALEKNAVIQLHSISGGVYRTQIDLFKYAFDAAPEDVYFWFGTDALGQDLFTILWQGSRVSIILAITINIVNIFIGILIGSAAGYYGGTFDLLFERFVDVLSNLPFVVILTLLTLRFGSTIGIVAFAFLFTGWISSYGTTRVQFYRYKNREYVLAARTFGAKDKRIMFKHIFPNAIGTLITSFSLAIPSFIFTEAQFSFLGIINYAEFTSVGRLISDGQGVMQQYPHMLLFPAVYISILMLSFNLFSNGLRDAFNPSLRGVE